MHDDPLALVILGEAQAAALRADPRRFEAGPAAPVLRAFLAVRVDWRKTRSRRPSPLRSDST